MRILNAYHVAIGLVFLFETRRRCETGEKILHIVKQVGRNASFSS